MRDLANLFAHLSRSRFRSRFVLGSKERQYLAERGRDVIFGHARDFVEKRLSAAAPPNDGRQTPMRGHPVFIAQHATATCCRRCLSKWHGIGIGRPLDTQEQSHVVTVIMRWLETQGLAG